MKGKMQKIGIAILLALITSISISQYASADLGDPFVVARSPSDGATDINITATLSVTVDEYLTGELVNVTFFDASDDSVIGTGVADTSLLGGDTVTVNWSGLSYNTTYRWYVTLDDGESNQTEPTWSFTTIDEGESPNQPPIANFTWTADELTVSFTDTSTDPDGTIVSWQWTFGDGASSNQQNPTHTYANNGTYYIYLVVIDNDGAKSDMAGCQIKISGAPAPPVASFTYSINGSTVTVNASASYDIDGEIVSYEWDWDSNGVYDDTYTIPTASHTYSAGTYIITLRVTDNDGYNDTTTSGSGGFIIKKHNNIWRLPFSWFAMFLMGFVGVIGFALGAFFMKPESIEHLGYAPAAGSILSTILIITTILLYHANVAWYWTALSVIGAFGIIFLTVKIVLASPKRKKIAKSIFKG